MNTEQQHKEHEVRAGAVRGDEQVAPPSRAVPLLAPIETGLPRCEIAHLPPGAAPALRKDITQ